MLKIHHLVLSRSERIVWLAEELGIEDDAVRYPLSADPRLPRPPRTAAGGAGDEHLRGLSRVQGSGLIHHSTMTEGGRRAIPPAI